MFRLLIFGLVYFFIISSPAWACGCVVITTGQLSDILEDRTLVYATPLKTEWLGGNRHTPLMTDYIRGYNFGRTTLIDAHVVGSAKQTKLNFFHPTYGNSCGLSPHIGSRSWYLLEKDSSGTYSSDYCLNKELPYGAILDFYHNGLDPIIQPRHLCPAYDRKKTPDENSELLKAFPECTFWLTNYSAKFKELEQNYILKDLGLEPLPK